jgi:aminopeptidase-like protein
VLQAPPPVAAHAVEGHGVGAEMHELIAALYPLCRSITGDGVRATLHGIGQRIPLDLHEVPTGTPVLDWTVPREWNVRDAWVKNAHGERVIDFRASNLHLVSYSVPVRARMRLAELRPRLHTLPEHPDWIPYRTSYYREDWGFCLTANQLAALEREDQHGAVAEYEVVIDSTLEPGALSYGECLVSGHDADEVIITAHVCHPSLANDNLSGIALAVALARHVARLGPRYSYRFIFAPGTIGAITWLARNEAHVGRIRHGLVLAGVGGAAPFVYKRSRRGDAAIDRAVAHVLTHAAGDHRVVDFTPYGYDERQYGSPGFDLAVGSLSRGGPGAFAEYHTSADNLDVVTPAALAESFARGTEIIAVLEGNATYVNTRPRGEPQLGRRGLYRAMGGPGPSEMAMLWVLNQSDGRHTLLDIAERASLPFAQVRAAADLLLAHDLLAPLPPPAEGTPGAAGRAPSAGRGAA